MRTVQVQATPEQFKKLNTYAEEIGVKIITPRPKKTVSKKEIDPNILDAQEQCKRLKNEIRRKYNEHAKVKVEYIV